MLFLSLPRRAFNNANLKRLDLSGKLSGAVLLASDEWRDGDDSGDYTPASFSDDRSCPNPDGSVYRDTDAACRPGDRPWNPHGEGIAFDDLDFPVLLVPDNETASAIVHDCFEEFNRPAEDGESRDWWVCIVRIFKKFQVVSQSPRNSYETKISMLNYFLCAIQCP